jgi:DNA ligase 1
VLYCELKEHKEIAMQTPADVVEALAATTKRTDKERILQAAWDGGIVEFFAGAHTALNSLVTFGIKRAPLIEEDDGLGSYTWSDFQKLSSQLQMRALTGHAARDAIMEAAQRAPARDWNLWYRRLLLKDLKCGTTESTINKVLKANGASAAAWMVPVFGCQLAKNGEDLPHKMKGRKLLDNKFDGSRLLTILDTTTNTVTQLSRDGRVNINFDSISQSLAKLIPYLKQSVVLDGEVISSSFQALMTQLKRKKADTSDSRLVLFDIIPLDAFRKGVYKTSQWDRHLALCELIPLIEQHCGDQVSVEPKLEVDLDTEQGQAAMQEFNRAALDLGLEGIMIKDPLAPYHCKRSDAWLKIKPFVTTDLEIVAVEPGSSESKFSHTMGNIVCEGTDQGRRVQVEVGTGFSEELRDQIWAMREKLLGLVVEIKGDAFTKNQHSDDVWSMRFPVFLRFRGWQPGEKI